MFTDLPRAELEAYQGSTTEPADFDAFWAGTLAESRQHPTEVTLAPVDTPLTTLDVYDVRFPGFAGQPIAAWLRVPRGAKNPLPTVVQYIGYGGGRGLAAESLLWASAGYAHLQVDSRGQGATWSTGVTPDHGSSGPALPGMMTRGITDPHEYYYRRLFTDAVRAIDAARTLPMVDAARVSVVGGSQGGGTALAVAGLVPDLFAAAAFVPFLCDFPRALTITDARPYKEIGDYLSVHRESVEQVTNTLAYFDGTSFARRAAAPALISVALMDSTCPPSTVYAAYNNYLGPKRLLVWPFNGHEGGGPLDEFAAIDHFRSVADH